MAYLGIRTYLEPARAQMTLAPKTVYRRGIIVADLELLRIVSYSCSKVRLERGL
jgi:hypothetical protein